MTTAKQANDIAKLGEAIEASRHLCVFSGAGISCPSGIPDFRSEKGLYRQKSGSGRRPEESISHSFFCAHPAEFYAFYREKMVYPNAKPNAAHRYFAVLEESGKRVSVVTQNIDGLHQAAGSKNVLELHGSIHRCYCMRCGRPYPAERVNHGTGVPHCDCGGIIRPDIVFYEECLDDDVVSRAVHYIREAEVLIVGGTSLAVYPAAGLLNYYRGNKLVLINRSATPYDDQANLIIHEKIGEVFAQV